MQFGRVVCNAELRLDPVSGNIHFRAGNERVAAHLRHLFKEHHIGAGVFGFNSGREPCTARTNHHDVIGSILGQILNRGFERLFIGLAECYTGLFSGIFNSVEHTFRRESCARDDVDLHGVGGSNLILQIRENFLGQNRVFGILQNVDFLNFAVVKSNSNSDVAVFADADAFSGDRGCKESGRSGAKSKGGSNCDQGFLELHDEIEPVTYYGVLRE